MMSDKDTQRLTEMWSCQGIDAQICHGNTCGAYGVCIDLVGNTTGYESTKARSLALDHVSYWI